MAKLPVLTPRKILKILREHGFVEDHQTGSHLVLYHHVSKCRVVVPIHSGDIPKGTLKSILRGADITLE